MPRDEPAALPPAEWPSRLTEIRASGRALRDDERAGLHAYAAEAADRGVTLDGLVTELHAAAYGVVHGDRPEGGAEAGGGAAARVPAEREGAGGVGGGHPVGEVAVLRAVAEAAVALAEGYGAVRHAVLRREEAGRREFAGHLLDGRAGLGRLAERAERFGLRPAGPYRVAVARAAVGADGFGAGDRAVRYVEEALLARFGRGGALVTTKDGLLVCVAPGTGDEAEVPKAFAGLVRGAAGPGCRVATGRARTGPAGAARSYQEALAALDVAERLGLDAALLDAGELLVFQVLGRDRAAITELVGTVLGGLEAARGGAGPLLATLEAYFATGCVNTATAARLGLSVRAVTYRLDRVHRLTGHDPADPAQRYTLQTAVLGARLLDWPRTPLEPTG
ncbi:CdaR family transcriptional regulator [Streptomyces sp. TRM64462]|uniref:PucR family transcriptional regulator n=1 Tax=Streptomyces sp. TRM64462 TaxID=2741726 RepID=UPI0015865EB1|nr:helix-turn-helix domain-containing protein [Streptomyces sp. TRM64462]